MSVDSRADGSAADGDIDGSTDGGGPVACGPDGFHLVGDPTCYACPGYTYSTADAIVPTSPSVTDFIVGASYDPGSARVVLSPTSGVPEPTDFRVDAVLAGCAEDAPAALQELCANETPLDSHARFSVEGGKLVIDLSEFLTWQGLSSLYIRPLWVRAGCASRLYSPTYLRVGFGADAGTFTWGTDAGYPTLTPAFGNLVPLTATHDDSNPDVTRDLTTGLEWERASDTLTTLLPWAESKAYCDGLTWAGRDDWRLPTRVELVTAFLSLLRTSSGAYWSSDPVLPADLPDGAWTMGAFGGLQYPATSVAMRRCVRGSLTVPQPRYSTPGDGTIRDGWTGLAWEATPLATTRTPEQAQSHCLGLTIDGGGWRVPTLVELSSLVDETLSMPCLDTSLFPLPGGDIYAGYLSSVPGTLFNSTQGGYAFHYDAGYSLEDYSNGYVRCVR